MNALFCCISDVSSLRSLFTARERSAAKVMFLPCVSVPTDLENRVAAPYPEIDSQVLHIEANFWQKVAATWGFCLAAAGVSPFYSNGNFNRL